MRGRAVQHRLWEAASVALTFLVFFAGSFANAVTGESVVADVVYDAAIEAARAGNISAALPIIEQRYRDNPTDVKIAFDYAVVLGWANRPADAVAIYEMLRMPATAAPAYVLSAIARNYRDLGRFDEAIALYRTGQQLYPQDPTFAYGEILALTDAHRNEEAITQAYGLLAARPEDPELLAALLYAFAPTEWHTETLAVARRLLAMAPMDHEARRQEVLQLRALGDLTQAQQLVQQAPADLFSPDERRDLANEAAAALVRKGELAGSNETERLRAVDEGIAALDRLITQFSAEGPAARPNLLRARFDRIVALGDRGRSDDIVAEYARLASEGVTLPAYALKVVADAYSAKRDPETALKLYQQLLASTPKDFQARVGLFYAQIETEDFDAAFRTIDALAADQPQFITGTRTPSPDWLRAQMIAALARYYAGDGPEAERRLQQLIAMAPWDAGLRQALASVWLGKGKPRLAEAQFAAAETITPGDVNVAAARADVAITRGDRAGAAATLAKLREIAPQNRSVQRLEQRLEILSRPEVIVRFNGTFQGVTVPTGGDNFAVEAQYFTAPFAHAYRLSLSYGLATADLPEGGVINHHLAVGVEYTGQDVAASGELTRDTSAGAHTGLRGAVAWMPDDRWRLGAGFQIFSADTPLRALRHDITANSYTLRAGYTISDRLAYNGVAEVVTFSDGNTRTLLDAVVNGRIFTMPHFTVDAGGELYGSLNSQINGPYFSPRHDFEAAASLALNQILYRRYSYVYSHGLTITAGDYWQSNFGGLFAGSISYEQRLRTSDAWEGVIGIRLRHQPYDGRGENSLAIFGSIDWRF